MRRAARIPWPRAYRIRRLRDDACQRFELIPYEAALEINARTRLAERERCAKLCDQLAANLFGGLGPAGQGRLDGYRACAEVIRMKKPQQLVMRIKDPLSGKIYEFPR